MKALVTVGLLAGLLAFAAPTRTEAQVHVQVGVALPGFGAVVTTGPVYVPAPVYAYVPPPPVYAYVPAPVFVHAPRHHPRGWYNKHYVRARGYWPHRYCHR